MKLPMSDSDQVEFLRDSLALLTVLGSGAQPSGLGAVERIRG